MGKFWKFQTRLRKLNTTLQKYLPERAVDSVFELIKVNDVHLKIVNQRQTKHGDYRRMSNGTHIITINNSLNKYAFLITLIHEIAHLVAFEKYGHLIKPHGGEWKYTFQTLMLPFIRPEVFPDSLMGIVANHFRNPKASSDTDARLSVALKTFDVDADSDKSYIFELLEGVDFRMPNGQVFKKGKKRIKRYECLDLSSGKVYLFQPNAQVEPLN